MGQVSRIDPTTVVAAVGGDELALEQVVDAWLPTVYQWCARLGAGRIDSEEAAHDVMMTFVRRHASVEPHQLGSWLFGTCRRVVCNHRRRAWWRRWVPGLGVEDQASASTAERRLEQDDLARQVAQTLDRLSDKHREVLVLCYLEERSVADAAALIGVSPGTVKSRLFYARAKFQQAFPAEEG
jgi:RNA polymerase sigma-70 factor (ECF subfamily)